MNTKGQHRVRQDKPEADTPPRRTRISIGMAAAGLKKGLTHGGGCQTAKQLTRSASPTQHPLPVPLIELPKLVQCFR